MEITRETTTFTHEGRDYVVKTYASAREMKAIQEILFRGAKIEMQPGKEPKLSDLDPTIQYDIQVEMVRQFIVSIDGTTDRLVERCEDLPHAVFDDLVIKLDGLIAKKKS